MSRPPNTVDTVDVHLSTTPQVKDLLESLAATGRFGKNASEVGEELLRAKLREVELEGWLERRAQVRGQKPRRTGKSRR
jgi:Arc/MetJ-type ribon-helix-helix transcriptional regulator